MKIFKWKVFSFFVLCFFTIACNKKTEEGSNGNLFMKSTSRCFADDRLKWILKDFLTEVNCPACFNELYIDKVTPQYYVLTLKSTSSIKSYNNSLSYIILDGKKIFMYTGAEDFFNTDEINIEKENKKEDSNKYILWNVFIKGDSIKVLKKGDLPFIIRDDDIIYEDESEDTLKWIYMPRSFKFRE